MGKEDRIKKLDQQISLVKGEIDKHKDTLSSLTDNQQFLLSLSDRDFLAERATKIEQSHEQVRLDWINEHKNNPHLDYDIIFTDNEDIHEQVKAQFSFR